MSKLSMNRLEPIHRQFIESADKYPQLRFLMVRPHDPQIPWPKFPSFADGTTIGLSDEWWMTVLRELAPQARQHPTILDSLWLSIDGSLWEGAFYRDEPDTEERDPRAGHKRDVAGVEEFLRLAGKSASHFEMPPDPSFWCDGGEVLRADGAHRWLEKLGSLGLYEECAGCSTQVRRLKGNVFTASARAIELLSADEPKAAVLDGIQRRMSYATVDDLHKVCDRRALDWYASDHLPTLCVPDAPASYQSIHDDMMLQRANEVWSAVNRLIDSIDIWQEWFRQLHKDNDADPAVALLCHETACQCIDTLCGHQVNAVPFNQESEDDIMKMLPRIPSWSMGGRRPDFDVQNGAWVMRERSRWQDDAEFLSTYYGANGRSITSTTLRGYGLQLRHMLEQFPLTVLRTEASSASTQSVDLICLSIVQVANFVGVSDRTIREWRKGGKLTVREGNRGQLLFSKSELEIRRQAQLERKAKPRGPRRK